jgi:hypothetical protein
MYGDECMYVRGKKEEFKYTFIVPIHAKQMNYK